MATETMGQYVVVPQPGDGHCLNHCLNDIYSIVGKGFISVNAFEDLVCDHIKTNYDTDVLGRPLLEYNEEYYDLVDESQRNDVDVVHIFIDGHFSRITENHGQHFDVRRRCACSNVLSCLQTDFIITSRIFQIVAGGHFLQVNLEVCVCV